MAVGTWLGLNTFVATALYSQIMQRQALKSFLVNSDRHRTVFLLLTQVKYIMSRQRPSAIHRDDGAGGETELSSGDVDGFGDVLCRGNTAERRELALLLQQFGHAPGVGAVDEAGRNADDANLRREGAGQAHRQVIQRRFAGAISDVAADGGAAGDGADVDDQAVAAEREERTQRAHAGDGATDVDAEDAIDQLVRQCIEVLRGDGLRDTSIVDEDIETAETSFHFTRQSGLSGAIFHRRAGGEMSGGAKGGQVRGQLLGGFPAARIGQRASDPGLGQAARDGRADAARSAGDEGEGTFQGNRRRLHQFNPPFRSGERAGRIVPGGRQSPRWRRAASHIRPA